MTQPVTSGLVTNLRYERVQSKRFLCARCLKFVIEIVPVLKAGMGRDYFEQLRKSGKVRDSVFRIKLECPDGHHSDPFWTFFDVNDPRQRRRR